LRGTPKSSRYHTTTTTGGGCKVKMQEMCVWWKFLKYIFTITTTTTPSMDDPQPSPSFFFRRGCRSQTKRWWAKIESLFGQKIEFLFILHDVVADTWRNVGANVRIMFAQVQTTANSRQIRVVVF